MKLAQQLAQVDSQSHAIEVRPSGIELLLEDFDQTSGKRRIASECLAIGLLQHGGQIQRGRPPCIARPVELLNERTDVARRTCH